MGKVKCKCCGKETYKGTFGAYCHIYCYLSAMDKEMKLAIAIKQGSTAK